MTAWADFSAVHFLVAVQKQKWREGTEGERLEMNLYRSFGNLMEAWVSEGGQSSDSEWPGNNDEDSPTPPSDMGTNLRSESVDSGVETASSETSFPANAEIEAFIPETEGLSPASTSQSPVLCSPPPSSSSSSSSPRLCPSRAQEGSVALHQKLEQALQRTDSKHRKAEPFTVDEVLRRRPRSSFLPKRHTSELVRGQRLESFGLRRTVNPLVPARQTCRRPLSMNCDRHPAQARLEELGEGEGKGLSPGLSYLEQVCQMLEDTARQQIHSRALQMEMKALRQHQHLEAFNTHHSGSKAAEEDLSSSRSFESTEFSTFNSSEPPRRKDYGHFRQRSASDTAIATLHLRMLNADCRGQHLNTEDLLENEEEEAEENEVQSKKEETNKSNKNWKFKIGSLRREEPAEREVKSQQMQSSEKNSARRRLSQLFRRNRRKTARRNDDE
ncbi:uncharacterized protein si:dkey-106l3.7 isoform X2 [Chelmon rostratus]|uniref:uncharacterized protein si:dkey-106l3.7 isoform X2 n=1 Tax=Chelmon rostratus TaxID=109905 RepID=UPI001BE62A67|nr:uncharacterized protein si:dkey-106l3.7 isoform X2 [Chelmon rostratus]